jgi:hypothetical protein
MNRGTKHDPRQASPLMWHLLMHLALLMLFVLFFAGSC